MTSPVRFTAVAFRNYKALRNYSVSLEDFNILVGPNNAGKSTIISSFRILDEAIRKARSKSPEMLDIGHGPRRGYPVSLEGLPVATENVFTNYDQSNPAEIEFRISNGNKLILHFPEPNACLLLYDAQGKAIRSPSDFRALFPVTIGHVPVLGPVEHEEPLFQKEAARRALATHGASRNFRNIWYHYPETFGDFRALVQSTWPGMDIEPPEVARGGGKPYLRMFCPEDRYPREIYWAGFGFQVWCQMLTFIVRSRDDSILVIDEPDIYLHSDLQRQLVGLLKSLPCDVLLATHSTEIISEADPGDLLVVNKKGKGAKRISDPQHLQIVFGMLGSNLNPILTQLAKTRHVVFVEGKDFGLLASFARRLNHVTVAMRSHFAVMPVEGFNPLRVREISKGIEFTIGGAVRKAVIFDRDFRSASEIESAKLALATDVDLVHIHARKEIENYLLEPEPLARAVKRRLTEKNKRTGSSLEFNGDFATLFLQLSETFKHDVCSQYLAKRQEYAKAASPHIDLATISAAALAEFDSAWSTWDGRKVVLPGKRFLSLLNTHLQDTLGVTVTPTGIVSEMTATDVAPDLKELLASLAKFPTIPRREK